MEKHLSNEEQTEYCEHGDAEYGPGRQQSVVLAPDGVEEEQHELLDEKRDAHTVDCAAVNVLVDLGALVGEVDVVSVHCVLDEEVEESEGGDEGADDGVGDGQREHQQHPRVVHAEGELVDDGAADRRDLGRGADWK